MSLFRSRPFPRPLDLRSLTVLVALTLAVPGASLARESDGAVLLSWSHEDAVRSGTSAIVQTSIPPEQLTLVLTGSGRERVVALGAGMPARVEGIDPGAVRIELRHGMGVLAVWQAVVRTEIVTPIEVDLSSGDLHVSNIAPEPFGNWETWDGETLRSIPGPGIAELQDFDTRAPHAQDPVLPGLSWGRLDRLRPRTVDLDQSILGAQRPLGSAAAYRAGAEGLRLLTRPLPGRGVTLGGSVGNGGRFLGHTVLSDRYTTANGSALDLSGQIQFSSLNVAGPLEALNATLEHDDQTAVEVDLRGSFDTPSERYRVNFYAYGAERNYYLNEFHDAIEHAPQENRGSLSTSFAYDRPIGAQDLSLEVGFAREFTETGDGTAFDDFSSYNRSETFPDVAPDGLYWLGDDPATPIDEGKLYDYYQRSLVEDFRVRAEFTRDLTEPRGLRAGAEIHWTTWRVFEHLRPSRVVANGDQAGYTGLTRNFGYTFDGDSQSDDPGHVAKSPRTLSLFASQKLRLGSAALDAGLRLDRFSPGQNPVRDLSDPIGVESPDGDPAVLDPTDLEASPSHDQLSPRVGLYAPFGASGHVWIDGGRRQIVPPFEALYYDADLLERLAGQGDGIPGIFGSSVVHGNPNLTPEDEWSGQLGLYHGVSSAIRVRLSGYASGTKDTWVVHSFERGLDSVAFYDNAGERRELGLHVGLELGKDAGIRVQYDLSRTETDVIEPYPLYEQLQYEGLPIGNVAVPQTRLRSTHWIDDGVDRGFFPSIFDRTHRISVLWSRSLGGFGDGTERRSGRIGLGFRFASGAPYTPTFVRKEGDLEISTDVDATTDPARFTGEINSERMPESWQIDFVYAQPFTILTRDVDLRLEVRNLTDHQNPQYVYPATGEADNDGWLDSPTGQLEIEQNGDSYRSDYEKAIESPHNYTEGITARVALSFALF
ncbi:MAG: hypothetical protein R3E97_20325 [Candidatus Eisenbacteria bacterium]